MNQHIVVSLLSLWPSTLWKLTHIGCGKGFGDGFTKINLIVVFLSLIIQKEGMSLGTFNCLAECNGAKVVKCVQGGTLEEFEEDVKWVSSSPAEERTMILNYSRKEFGQTGDGHFSPMGGYHPALKVGFSPK